MNLYTIARKYKLLRNAGDVVRFHSQPVLQSQTIAAHSWGVATFIATFVPNPSANLLTAALYHDVAEVVTGDIPSPAKWRWPELKAVEEAAAEEFMQEEGFHVPLTEEEAVLLKLADALEGMSYTIKECSMGNGLIRPVVAVWREHIKGMLDRQKDEHLERAGGLQELYRELCLKHRDLMNNYTD